MDIEKNVAKKDGYGFSRFMYILEAAFEYFISTIVAGAYLAKLTSEIGLSDAITGILSSFVSLGCGFQLIAIFLANKRPVKRWVTILHILNQLFFALIYFVPFVPFSKTGKTLIFIFLFLLGHIINNIVNSPKINWFMSLVDDRKRGKFTANKEIISLLGGMVFSLAIGSVIDHYEAIGDVNSAFIFCGVGVFVLMLLHTATLIFSKEKPAQTTETVSTKKLLLKLLKDKGLFKVILISILWNVAHFTITPFMGSYEVKDLGFSMTLVSIYSIAYSICRALFSRALGRYADKHSFTKMLNICFIVAMASFAVNIFTVPSNGKILFAIYKILYAVAMAGINSGAINLIYDYVDKENRVGALALKSSLAGFAGFFTTLVSSILVDYIQKNGNTFLGLNVYAQQVMSFIATILVGVLLIYLNTVIKKMKKEDETKNG